MFAASSTRQITATNFTPIRLDTFLWWDGGYHPPRNTWNNPSDITPYSSPLGVWIALIAVDETGFSGCPEVMSFESFRRKAVLSKRAFEFQVKSGIRHNWPHPLDNYVCFTLRIPWIRSSSDWLTDLQRVHSNHPLHLINPLCPLMLIRLLAHDNNGHNHPAMLVVWSWSSGDRVPRPTTRSWLVGPARRTSWRRLTHLRLEIPVRRSCHISRGPRSLSPKWQ